MSWDAIAAGGEVVGALAVVVSVVYLAVQIRKQTAESQLAATRELSVLYINSLKSVREDKELLAIYLKATQDYDGLPIEERYRIAILIQEVFRVFEQHFVHIQQNKVDQMFVESINLSFQEWLTFPGIQRWWELSNDMFVVEYREYVANLIEKAKVRGYNSTFDQRQS